MSYGTNITRITLRDDCPTAVSSTVHKANLDCFGFNMGFIQKRDPELSVEVMKLYERAHKLRDIEPLAKDDRRFMKAHQAFKEFIAYSYMEPFMRDTRMHAILEEFKVPTPVEGGHTHGV